MRIKQMDENHGLEMKVIYSAVRLGPEQHEPEGELEHDILEVSKSLPAYRERFLSSILDAKFAYHVGWNS